MDKIRIGGAYATFFISAILLVAIVLVSQTGPEKTILGQWREMQWEYEKVDKQRGSDDFSGEITESVKAEIMKGLIIHEAEMWEFLPDGKLLLHKKNSAPTHLEWRLKGRGHVLKVKHPNDSMEFYELSELNKDQMVLYFNTDLQARGIVKMIFNKVQK